MAINWKKYLTTQRERSYRPLLAEAVLHVAHKGAVLDIGAGALRDSEYLLEQGFEHVTAIDADPTAAEYAAEITDARFHFILDDIAAVSLQHDSYDLINAQYVLPWLPPTSFDRVAQGILTSLRQGGVFTGQFFGERNEITVAGNEQTLHSNTSIRDLFTGMEIIRLDEEETDKPTALGDMTHHHIFHCIVRKPLHEGNE